MLPARRITRLIALLLLASAVLATLSVGPPARAQDELAVAYVYQNDVVSRDSFKAELELRGFSFTPITLSQLAAEIGPDLSPYDVIIVAHDTGAIGTGSAWLGSVLAGERIVRSGKYVLGVGFGGSQFFSIPLINLKIGFNAGVTDGSSDVEAVNPGDAAWLTPNAVPIAADGSVRLYSGLVGGRFASPPDLTNVTLIGRVPGPKEGTFIYPLAAERHPQFETPCFTLWGHRGAPAFMTPAGRDTLENLLRTPPCGQEGRVRADVAISKTGPANATVGQNISYSLKVDVLSRVDARAVRVEDRLPEGVSLVSVNPSVGSCRAAPRRVVCELGNMADGSSATIALVLKASEVGALLNRAYVSGRFEDTNPANNRAEATTTVSLPLATPLLRALPYRPIFNGPLVAIPSSDLSIHGIEFTQGIQCFDTSQGLASCADNSLPMVARKSTTARIYLRISGGASVANNVPVRLVLIDANNVEYVVNTVGKALPNIDRANASSSANVYFSVNFNSTVPVRYYAIVDPNGAIAETNENNNRFPAAGTRSINFTPSRTMKIVSQRLRYHPSGYSGAQYAGGWAVNGGAAQWFEQLMPIRSGGVTHQVASGYLDWTTSLSGGSGQHALIEHLNTRWLMQNTFSWLFGTGAYTGARHVYGWAPNDGYSGGHADMPIYPHAGGLGVVGIGTDRPGTSTDNPGGGALIFGHEIVHDYDVKHTDTPDACGSGDSSSNWPYATSSIQEFGFNPITGKVYNPSNTHDILSYCPAGGSRQGWISPYTWNYMFNRLKVSGVTQLAQEETAETVLAVSLSVSNPDLGPEQGTFLEVNKVDASAPLVTPAPGDYALELRDSGGTVLSTTPFVINFKSEYNMHNGDHPGELEDTATASVHMAIPWQEGTSELRILHGDTVIGSRQVSALPPSVLITSPAAPETWQPDTTETISWEASDPDSDSLIYSLFYSRDGEEWQLLASGLSETSYEIAVNDLAGSSEARFRVVANDGVNIGDDETPPIVVPDQAPTAAILNPSNGADLPLGELLVLQGLGSDFEDGLMPDVALSWSSDRAGPLGTGAELPLANLSQGAHTITLSVTDSAGQTTTTSVDVFVGARLFLPNLRR